MICGEACSAIVGCVTLCRGVLLAAAVVGPGHRLPFCPPAVPLVASNPYLSIWSEADRLTDDTTRHWTGREHPLVSLIRIDGKGYRLMGKTPAPCRHFPRWRAGVADAEHLRLRRHARPRDTHVSYAALPDDLEALARPLTYLTWEVRSVDGATHAVSIFDSTS